MSQYLKLKVKNVVKETAEAVSLVFEKGSIKYKPGQFLTFIFTIKGEQVRRSYSLCTAPEFDELPAVTIKRVPGGKMSNYIADSIKPGDAVEVLQPAGTFCIEPNPGLKRTVVLIGAGSGITPLMGIGKAVLASEFDSKVYLVYGNRREETIIFRNGIEELEKKFPGKFKAVHILSQPSASWNSHKGRLSQSEVIKMLEDFPSFDFKNAEYFVCGPEGMMEEAMKALQILNISREKIRKESFVNSTLKEAVGTVVEKNQSDKQEVVIIYQGTEYKFVVPPGQTILEAAMDKDIDLPYSCQSGMCTACMGKCKSGKVHLDNPDGLSDKEIEQGYVLTCVGHPVSPDVVIEID